VGIVDDRWRPTRRHNADALHSLSDANQYADVSRPVRRNTAEAVLLCLCHAAEDMLLAAN